MASKTDTLSRLGSFKRLLHCLPHLRRKRAQSRHKLNPALVDLSDTALCYVSVKRGHRGFVRIERG